MKRIVLISVFILVALGLYACDICGCSAGNYFIGPFPEFKKHFFGSRYTYRKYNSFLADDKSEFSKDFYQTFEFWGGYNLSKKWQIMAFIPFNLNKQSSDEGINKSHGIGDISLLANYSLLNSRNKLSNKNRISQQLLIGAGLKLPTGSFKANPENIIPDANNQPGTGSVDLIFNMMYSYHINDWGINSNVNYKINSMANHFEFGNRFNSSAFLFHSIELGKSTLNPNVGLLFEKIAANKLNDNKIENTGGNALLTSVGLDVNLNKIIVGFNEQLPVQQNLSNRQTSVKSRGMIHLTFIF